MDIRDLIKEVLENGYVMSLGTQDEGGVWVADVIYIHDDDLNMYWMSSPRVRHSQAILKNNQVAGTITVSHQSGDEKGVQFEGVAEKTEGSRYDLALKHYAKRGKPAPSQTDDVLGGDSWYVLKPKRIELIYGKIFGFKKQKLEHEKF